MDFLGLTLHRWLVTKQRQLIAGSAKPSAFHHQLVWAMVYGLTRLSHKGTSQPLHGLPCDANTFEFQEGKASG